MCPRPRFCRGVPDLRSRLAFPRWAGLRRNFQRQCEQPDRAGGAAALGGGTTQQWNFTIQRELGRDWFAELGYVGTKGTACARPTILIRLTLATPQNPVTIPGQGCANLQAQEPGPARLSIRRRRTPAPARLTWALLPPISRTSLPTPIRTTARCKPPWPTTFRRGLFPERLYLVQVDRRRFHRVSVAFLTRVNDQNNARASRGLSDFDRRQRFVTSAVYQLPFFTSRASGLTKRRSGRMGGQRRDDAAIGGAVYGV
jgi:hypothetical protein